MSTKLIKINWLTIDEVHEMRSFSKTLIFKRSLNTFGPSSSTSKTCYHFEIFAKIPTVFKMFVFSFGNLGIYETG